MDDWEEDLKGISEEDEDEEQYEAEGSNTIETVGSKRKGKAPAGDGEGDSDNEGEAMDEDNDDKEDKKLLPVPEGGVKPAEELNPDEIGDLKGYADPDDVAKLSSSESYKDTIKKIDQYRTQPPSDMSNSDSPEYQVILKANHLSVEIDNEIFILHKFVKDHYMPRFPELDSVVTIPLDYCKAAQAIGNPDVFISSRDFEKLDLTGVLPSATIMVVTMSATTTKGTQLPAAQWAMVQKACRMVEDLSNNRQKISDYIESRISVLAPNLSAIVGTRTATKLLSISGGLDRLSKIPADSIYLLGAQKKAALGFSGMHRRRHTGFIYDSELVQSLDEEYRRRAQHKVAGKCALAARMDLMGGSKDGSYGRSLLETLEKMLDKMSAPPPVKVTKALPKPQENSRKRRGGKRARKAKEQYAQSELQKLQNRVKFGEAEDEVGAFDETVGMGMIGSSSGKIRASTGETRTKAKMSKSKKNRLATLNSQAAAASGTATSGISSSLAFTPFQGIELVDPRIKKVNEANEKWFGGGTFSFIGNKGGGSSLLPKKE